MSKDTIKEFRVIQEHTKEDILEIVPNTACLELGLATLLNYEDLREFIADTFVTGRIYLDDILKDTYIWYMLESQDKLKEYYRNSPLTEIETYYNLIEITIAKLLNEYNLTEFMPDIEEIGEINKEDLVLNENDLVGTIEGEEVVIRVVKLKLRR